jgi:hypothetical protein
MLACWGKVALACDGQCLRKAAIKKWSNKKATRWVALVFRKTVERRRPRLRFAGFQIINFGNSGDFGNLAVQTHL